jgi:hypothetical protein
VLTPRPMNRHDSLASKRKRTGHVHYPIPRHFPPLSNVSPSAPHQEDCHSLRTTRSALPQEQIIS